MRIIIACPEKKFSTKRPDTFTRTVPSSNFKPLAVRRRTIHYEAKFNNGAELLELREDGTYIQDFNSKSRPFHHTGHWRVDNALIDGSQVVLADASVSEGDEARPLAFGELRLYTHDRLGKIALARNEIADWYYERTH